MGAMTGSSSSLLAAVSDALTKRLEGKVALITGGASGIGECTAKLFWKHGAKVVIADVQECDDDSWVSNSNSTTSTFVHCDVTNEEHVRNAVDTAVAKYGKLDIMFNNAGIPGNPKPRIIDNDKADFERVLSVNLTGVFLGMKHAARVMVPAGGGGSIISSASVASGMGGCASHAYTSSKFGVLGLTKNAAVELGQFGIRVNCLSPYALATPLSTTYLGMEPQQLEELMASKAVLKGAGLVLKADDVANAALFLASDEAKYVSGQNLFIDGGFTVTNSAMQVFHYPTDDHQL